MKTYIVNITRVETIEVTTDAPEKAVSEALLGHGKTIDTETIDAHCIDPRTGWRIAS